MSTQSIQQIEYSTLIDGVNKALTCIGNRFLLIDSFGVKDDVDRSDIVVLMYYKRFLNNEYCKVDVSEYQVEQINKLILKYQ